MKQPKCRDCGQPIVWFTVRRLGARRPFEAKPVDPARDGRRSFPVEGGAIAWTLSDLVEELQGRREISHDEADEEARAMPFYVRHSCPNAPDRPALQETHA